MLNTFDATPLVCFIPNPTKDNFVIFSSIIILFFKTYFETISFALTKSSFGIVNETVIFELLIGAV